MRTENIVYSWILVMLGLLFAYAIYFFAMRYTGFKRELWYINMELGRSEEEEQSIWKKQKLRLFLSLIPFVQYRP